MAVVACGIWRTVDDLQGKSFTGAIAMLAMVVLLGCVFDATRDLGAKRRPMKRAWFSLVMFFLIVPAMIVAGGLEHLLASRQQIRLVSDIGAMVAGLGAFVICLLAQRRRGAAILR